MSNSLLVFVIKALSEGLALGVSVHKLNGTFLPTVEVHELKEGQ